MGFCNMSVEHLLIFIFLWEVLRAENYAIIQRIKSISSESSRTWKAEPDQFTIPSSLCNENDSAQCNQMGGSQISKCTCQCDQMASNGRDLRSSTFGFDGGRWRCLENAKVHEQSGCSIILNNWANDSALLTVPNVGFGDYELPKQFRNIHIYKAGSKVQNCHNTWKHLDYETYVREKFSIHRVNNTQYLKFNFSGNSSQQIMAGRIIKLGLEYLIGASNMITHTCVLLKMQGEIKCPFMLPPTATPPTSEPSSVLLTTTESSLSTSMKSTANPNTHTTTSGSPTVTMSTGQTSLPMVIKTSARNHSTSSDDSAGLIAGAVAGVIGLMVLVIVMLLVRRRKKRKIANSTDVVQEENGYATNRVQPPLEDQDEYAYAYASTVSINERHVDHHPTNKDPIPDADYVNQGNPDFNNEVEYEIMSNTETDMSMANKEKEKTNNETLDSTMYCSLVGNVPHIYGSLKRPHKAHENEADRQVMRTCQNKENDTYQQLNTFGQQKPGEYQVPNYNRGKPADLNSRV